MEKELMTVATSKIKPCTWDEMPSKLKDSLATGIYNFSDKGIIMISTAGVIALGIGLRYCLSQLKKQLS